MIFFHSNQFIFSARIVRLSRRQRPYTNLRRSQRPTSPCRRQVSETPGQLTSTMDGFFSWLHNGYKMLVDSEINETCKVVVRQTISKLQKVRTLHSTLATMVKAEEKMKTKEREWIQREKKLLDVMERSIKEAEDEACNNIKTCSICIQVEKDTVLIPCSHTFCHTCVEKMIKINGLCSYCRGKINGSHAMHLTY